MDEPRDLEFFRAQEMPDFKGAFVGRLPAGIDSSKELFEKLADTLKFPAYFGANWNALYDCLSDFHWMDKKEIVLVHQDVPNLPEDELAIYLDVLRDAIANERASEHHAFRAVFDQLVEGKVRALVKRAG